MLTLDCTHFENRKNLLAFSAGVDSSALFFLLIKNHIPFDIAIVDYGIRSQSKTEIAHAKALARQYNLKCYTIEAPQFKSHFEAHARAFRYKFFEKIIREQHYDTLLTAHQLNDQLEWLLMRFTKGAGVSELLGLDTISQREGYTLIRPLLEQSKEELLDYLNANEYPYFVDETNYDAQYERNRFRKQFSNVLISEYKEGIKRSFTYLREDSSILKARFKTIYSSKKFRIIKLYDSQAKSKAVDLALKELGYLLSAFQRQEIMKEKSLVIGGKWAIEQQDNLLYISPYITITIPKKVREKYRIHQIPTKIRPYLYQEDIVSEFLIPNS